MNKNFLILLTGIALFLIPLKQQASAKGIGLYGGYSYSENRIEYLYNLSRNTEMIQQWFGAGIVYDTAVAKDKLFNYRLNFGIGQLVAQQSLNSPCDHKGFQIDFINSFGFGIVRIPFLRLWLGPQLGLRFNYFRYDTPTQDISQYSLLVLPGAVLGFNFNIGSLITIGLDGGFRYNLGLRVLSDHDSSHYFDDVHYTDVGPEGFVNLSIIFRINDTMKNKPRQKEPESDVEESQQETNNQSKGTSDNKATDDDIWFEE